MKIIQLHAENFKRLGLVEITPDGNLITVGGKNGHGKSSVLDAIYVALRGRSVAPPQPIRKGEEKCTIRLDMGDLIVTRNFHQKDGGEYTDTLKVENADGLRYSKPDAMLKSLLGEVGFDPFSFVNLKPKDQVKQLLEMVPLSIDLDEFAAADQSDYDKRRDVNRDANALKAQIEGIPKEDVPEGVPDRNALTDQLGNAANTNSDIDRERTRREQLGRDKMAKLATADADRKRADELRAEAARMIAAADAKVADADAMEEAAVQMQTDLDALDALPEFVDTDAIREQLREAEATLALIERQNRRADLVNQWRAKADESKALTEAMAARAEQRNAALAEAEMPVEGLSFAIGEDGDAALQWEGLPFDKDQISTAAQLRVSTAIGMAANPRLRVLRIADGSLLDEDSMAMLAEMAAAEDFQLWIEVVGDGGVGIIMENGMVRGSEEEAAATQDEAPAKDKPKAKSKADSGEKLL